MAAQRLKAGIRMKKGNIDAYIADFESLCRQAGFRVDEPTVLDFFTQGLPPAMYEKIIDLDEPRNYTEWKAAALKRQGIFIHKQAHDRFNKVLRKIQPTRPNPPPQRSQGWGNRGYPPPNDPNAMDTRADRSRNRLANAEEVLARDV